MFLKGLSSSLLLFVLGKKNDDGFHIHTMTTEQVTTTTTTTTTTATSLYSSTEKRTLEICLSPGCVADGANEVLLKLQALSSSSSSSSSNSPIEAVVPGVCVSLCGNGPVAKDTISGKKHRKLSSNKKLLELLSLEGLDSNQKAVLEAIDLCFEGDKAAQRKNYAVAIQKYSKGIEKGMGAAVTLASNSAAPNNNDLLQWLIMALCNEGTAKINTKDIDGAIISAGTAFQLSRKKSPESLEILQEAYQGKGDDVRELGALEALFKLYDEQQQSVANNKKKRPTSTQVNKRRTLGFRLSKLQATA